MNDFHCERVMNISKLPARQPLNCFISIKFVARTMFMLFINAEAAVSSHIS